MSPESNKPTVTRNLEFCLAAVTEQVSAADLKVGDWIVGRGGRWVHQILTPPKRCYRQEGGRWYRQEGGRWSSWGTPPEGAALGHELTYEWRVAEGETVERIVRVELPESLPTIGLPPKSYARRAIALAGDGLLVAGAPTELVGEVRDIARLGSVAAMLELARALKAASAEHPVRLLRRNTKAYKAWALCHPILVTLVSRLTTTDRVGSWS